MTLPLRLAAPLTRFSAAAGLRRIPFPALALAVCLLFAAAGVAVLDDYGVSFDEPRQRHIAIVNADYIMGDRDAFNVGLPDEVQRFYGVAFELPLLLIERALGLQDSRSIYLSRHLLTHLFFIAGGFCCGLLVWRMFNNRWVALLAMLLFMLHPRLYAHSFSNSKDIPFLVMFVIALYLMHRAFRRDTLGAFVLLGIIVGLAANMRPFALLLVPATLAMLGLDWRFVGDAARRKRVLYTGGVFGLAALAALYVSHPYYWENPLRFFEGLQTLSQHPVLIENRFQGQFVRSDAVPPHYIPVWFGITAPPLALLLGILGAAAVLWRVFREPRQALRRGELRCCALLLGCFILPVAVAIILQSNIYNGWRQMYFLWAPFCLVAVAGGRYIYTSIHRNLWRAAMYVAAIAVVGSAAYAIVSLHPHQQIYFNLLVNRMASDQLVQQYDMDYQGTAAQQGLEYLLERYPDTMLYVRRDWQPRRNRLILPAGERERIAFSEEWDADFHLIFYMDPVARARVAERGLAVYELRAYGSAYLTVVAPRLVWGGGVWPGAEVYRAAYRRLTAAESRAAESVFDVYIHDGALYYVKDDCVLDAAETRFFMHLFPVDADDVPPHRRFEARHFRFGTRGGFFDGKCITQEPLPDYPIARIRTGQQIIRGENLWAAEVNPSAFADFEALEARLVGLRPAAAAEGFDLYWDGGTLIYRRESCDGADVAARFYLHVFPADANDLPVERRQLGFVNWGFDFAEYGAVRGGKCLAAAPLPDYPIARIRTGQHRAGEGEVWRADFRGGQ